MVCARLFVVLCFSCGCAAAALADTATSAASEEGAGGVTPMIRTMLSLPFKGVVCLAGLLSMPVAYVGSGLDPEVKNDATEISHRYCSGEYFFGSQGEGR